MILVVAEQREGKLNRASLETIAAAQTTGAPVKAALLGSGIDSVANEIAAADIAEVITMDDGALKDYTADGWVLALAQLVGAEQPERVFLPHTYQTRDFAPALAARLGQPLVTDCVAIKSGAYVRPMFQG